jgi:hypothetical protein
LALEFVYLYREFGGDLWIRDSRQRLATEISVRAPALQLMKQLQGGFVSKRLTSLNFEVSLWLYSQHFIFFFAIIS